MFPYISDMSDKQSKMTKKNSTRDFLSNFVLQVYFHIHLISQTERVTRRIQNYLRNKTNVLYLNYLVFIIR